MTLEYLPAFVHLQYLYFLSYPEVFFWEGNGAIGFGVPLLVSMLILARRRRPIRINSTLVYMALIEVADIAMGIASSHWSRGSLGMFPAGEVIWPVVILMGMDIQVTTVYPLTFVGALVPDLYEGGSLEHWEGAWYSGVGGAGFHDGLFIIPLCTLLLSIILKGIGEGLRRRGIFSTI